MKTLHLPIFTILMAFLVAAVSFLPQDAHAMSITVHTDKPLYSYGDTYTISGKVNPVIQNQVVSIVILSPNYPHPSSLSATPNSDGNYSYTLPLTIKDISSGNFTVIAQYGIAKNQTTFSYNGPPCVQQNNYWYDGVHSAPASNPRIVDSFGNAITGPVKSGQQIQVTSDLANGKNCAQTFAYIVQIEDLNGVTFSLSWITGTLLAGQSINPAQSWIPTTAGVYTVQIFTWQSLDNPNALAPPLTTTISVEDDANLIQSSHAVSEISPKLFSGPTTIILNSPLEQFKSGILADDVKCGQGLQLVIKTKDGSPACARPQTAQKLVERKWGWAMQPIDSIKPLPNRIMGLEDNTGIVTFGNQNYYFVTPNYTDTAYSNPVQVSFHDVVFTLFPPGFRGGLPSGGCGNDDTVGKIVTGGGSYYWADAKFSDGVHELLHMFADSNPCPIYPKQTMFSNHTNPQAGLTFYDGKMKLLVSTDNQVSSSTNYTESKVADDATYLSQTVDEWKSKTPEQLRAYYEKYKDAFYDQLGSFLIKDEMKKELARQKIQNIHDDFKVFPGMSLDSLPPHISYDAVVNATDGNSYLLLGGVFANKIESSPKIIKLIFDKNALHSLSTGNGPSYPDPSANAHVDNSTSQEKLQIAGTYIEDSDIPWSSVGTGNYGVIQIGLYTSVYHMIPDAQKYYTARAMQLIPFYVPVKILPPPPTEKQN